MAASRLPRWLRPRFSLRLLFIVVALFAIACGTFVREARLQTAARDAIDDAGGECNLSPHDDDGLFSLLGIQRVYEVTFEASRFKAKGPPNVDMEGFIIISKFPAIDDARFQHVAAALARVKTCYWLRMPGGKITDSGLESVARLPQLKGLDLTATQITDAGLAHLQALQNLEYLDLSETAVTDDGMKYICKLKNLKGLCLYYSLVTAKGVAEVKEALPQAEVTWYARDLYPPERSSTDSIRE